MTDTDHTSGQERRARIETSHGDSETAAMLARALTPDNTAEMDTRVEEERVVTTITRGTTGSLHSTVDDYVRNLQLGVQLVTQDREPSTTADSPDRAAPDTGTPRETHDTRDT